MKLTNRLMKYLIAYFLISLTAYSQIPFGNYKIQKVSCADNTKALDLGGSFLTYDINLNVSETQMTMQVSSKAVKDNASFLVDCNQVNQGTYKILNAYQYEGFLDIKSIQCRNIFAEGGLWYYKYGYEKKGVFDYSYNEQTKILTTSSPNATTKYSCGKRNSYPIYHYIKID